MTSGNWQSGEHATHAKTCTTKADIHVVNNNIHNMVKVRGGNLNPQAPAACAAHTRKITKTARQNGTTTPIRQVFFRVPLDMHPPSTKTWWRSEVHSPQWHQGVETVMTTIGPIK